MNRRAHLSVAIVSIGLLASCGVPQAELPPFGPIEQPMFGCPSMQGVYLWTAPASHEGLIGMPSDRKAGAVPKQLWLKESSLLVELRTRDINLDGNVRSRTFRDWSRYELTKSKCTSGLLGVGVNTRLARMRDGSLAVGVLSPPTGTDRWSWVKLRRIGAGDVAPAPLDASLAHDERAAATQPRSQGTPSERPRVELESLLPPEFREGQRPSAAPRPDSIQALAASMSLPRRVALLAAALIAAVMLFFAAARVFGERRTAWAVAAVWFVAVLSYYLARLGYYGGAALMMLVPATVAVGLVVLFAVVIAYRVYSALFFPPRSLGRR